MLLCPCASCARAHRRAAQAAVSSPQHEGLEALDALRRAQPLVRLEVEATPLSTAERAALAWEWTGVDGSGRASQELARLSVALDVVLRNPTSALAFAVVVELERARPNPSAVGVAAASAAGPARDAAAAAAAAEMRLLPLFASEGLMTIAPGQSRRVRVQGRLWPGDETGGVGGYPSVVVRVYGFNVEDSRTAVSVPLSV